jgi:hypothetical protein
MRLLQRQYDHLREKIRFYEGPPAAAPVPETGDGT